MKEHAGGAAPIGFSKRGKKTIPCRYHKGEQFDVEITPTVDFDWQSVEAQETGSVEFDWASLDPDTKSEVMEQALTVTRVTLTKVLDWMFAGGEAMPQGVMIRAYIVGWTLLPYMQGLKQTDLTRLMGLNNKQSVGRNASDWRDKFKVVNAFMQSERARATCRKREQTKAKK